MAASKIRRRCPRCYGEGFHLTSGCGECGYVTGYRELEQKLDRLNAVAGFVISTVSERFVSAGLPAPDAGQRRKIATAAANRLGRIL